MTMRKSRQILAVVLALLGLALIVKGAIDGLWPLSIQFIAGILLVAFAFLRWRTL
jgi:hypothetical protein